ncbi:MAG: hypothetical protein RIQ56_1025 [Candidatus Parcubacteria bacterium]|jgi:acyl dehydratase
MFNALFLARPDIYRLFDPLALWHYEPRISEPIVVRTYTDAFTVGDKASLTRRFSRLEILMFCWLSGDWNPVHWDVEKAQKSRFAGIIAHGFFVGSLASTLFGTAFPGADTIYLSQTMNFRAVVRPEDSVVFSAEIVEIMGEKRNRARLKCLWTVRDKVVLEGEAVLLLP